MFFVIFDDQKFKSMICIHVHTFMLGIGVDTQTREQVALRIVNMNF